MFLSGKDMLEVEILFMFADSPSKGKKLLKKLRSQISWWKSQQKAGKKKTRQRTTMLQRRKSLELELSHFMSAPALDFVCSQLRLFGRKKKGTRFTHNDKALALAIFHTSPKAYRLLKQIFILPSVSTLRKIMRNVQVYPGFNDHILQALKVKVSGMGENSNLCCIAFDEMSIKENVSYNQERDYIEGLEDFGNYGRTKYVANHATVFMIRGLTFNWKQAVGYFLSGPMNATLLHTLLLECIDKLQESLRSRL